MSESTYQCKNCGFIGRYAEPTRADHYKGNPPNCPTCHRAMSEVADDDREARA